MKIKIPFRDVPFQSSRRGDKWICFGLDNIYEYFEEWNLWEATHYEIEGLMSELDEQEKKLWDSADDQVKDDVRCEIEGELTDKAYKMVEKCFVDALYKCLKNYNLEGDIKINWKDETIDLKVKSKKTLQAIAYENGCNNIKEYGEYQGWGADIKELLINGIKEEIFNNVEDIYQREIEYADRYGNEIYCGNGYEIFKRFIKSDKEEEVKNGKEVDIEIN